MKEAAWGARPRTVKMAALLGVRLNDRRPAPICIWGVLLPGAGIEKWAAPQEGLAWSAFPWSWRPPRSSTGKTKVVGLVELSMPAPLYHAYHDGITSYYLALCDPPTGGPTYCRPLSGCCQPVRQLPQRAVRQYCDFVFLCRWQGCHDDDPRDLACGKLRVACAPLWVVSINGRFP